MTHKPGDINGEIEIFVEGQTELIKKKEQAMTGQTKAQIGSISSGTMRPEDLGPIFLDELEGLDKEKHDNYCRGLVNFIFEDKYDDLSDNEIINELIFLLNDYAPPYCYFGANPGDGADYGFWIDEDLEQSFDGLKVSDTSEIPDDYAGEAIHVNDHGNMTLYSCDKGKLTEIWAVV